MEKGTGENAPPPLRHPRADGDPVRSSARQEPGFDKLSLTKDTLVYSPSCHPDVASGRRGICCFRSGPIPRRSRFLACARN